MKARLRLPLLRAISWACAPRGRAKQSPPHGEARLLLIRPDHLGDVLFATPALRALRTALPDAHISCIVGPWAAPVLARNPHVNEVLTCPFPGFARRPKRHFLEPYLILWSEAQKLQSKSFDAALVMRFDHWWGGMLACWAGIPRRIGYDLPAVTPFLTRPAPYSPGGHEVRQNMRLVSAFVGQHLGEPGPLEFRPQPEAFQAAEGLLREAKTTQDVLCIHPGAGAAVKLWRPEAFAQVADELAHKYALRVVITGSSEERPLADTIARYMSSPPLILAGQTGLDELAVVLSRSRLVIGVDSGPLHLAVSLGTPTIHLFGPTDPRLFGPWGDPKKHIAVATTMDCAPCNRLDYLPHELADHPCVRSIPTSTVLEAAETLLATDSHGSQGHGIMAHEKEPGSNHVT